MNTTNNNHEGDPEVNRIMGEMMAGLRRQDEADARERADADEGPIVIDANEREWIMDALILGLTCWGEVEKARAALAAYEEVNGERPTWLDVREPGDDVTARMATALSVLQ